METEDAFITPIVTSSATVTVTVSSIPDIPVAQDDVLENHGISTCYNVLTNDFDADGGEESIFIHASIHMEVEWVLL